MREPLTQYWVNKHSMVSEQSMLRTSSDIPMYHAADVEALLSDLVRKWASQTGAREGVTFRVAMKNIQAFLNTLPKEQP